MTEPVEVAKLRPFSLEEWKKDEKHAVWWVASGSAHAHLLRDLHHFDSVSEETFAAVLVESGKLHRFRTDELRLGPKPSRWVNLFWNSQAVGAIYGFVYNSKEQADNAAQNFSSPPHRLRGAS